MRWWSGEVVEGEQVQGCGWTAQFLAVKDGK